MKKLLRSITALWLAFLARLVIAKYKPRIVMVTGSVGKTSTKDAVRAALSSRAFVRASEKSYNSEFGVPLTILGSKNPWTDALGWFRVLKEACALLLLPNHYPTILVLEVGADRPGDLAKILRIATPDVVVVTWLPEIPVHVEAYISPEAVREEEFVPAYGLAQGAPLIIASEDHHARTYA
ncbi:MAG: Mur ligase family protein, partial [Minisyncoccia bacterium]